MKSPYKDSAKSMRLTNDLVSFAVDVLSMMENEKEWSADILDTIAETAQDLELARLGADGHFESLVR